ncbi:MAG: hypothetical protein ACI4QT_05040 [Kiritimatiellia bacterium]
MRRIDAQRALRGDCFSNFIFQTIIGTSGTHGTAGPGLRDFVPHKKDPAISKIQAIFNWLKAFSRVLFGMAVAGQTAVVAQTQHPALPWEMAIATETSCWKESVSAPFTGGKAIFGCGERVEFDRLAETVIKSGTLFPPTE